MTRDLRSLMTEREDEILSVEEDIANGEVPISFARWQQASEDERAAIAVRWAAIALAELGRRSSR